MQRLFDLPLPRFRRGVLTGLAIAVASALYLVPAGIAAPRKPGASKGKVVRSKQSVRDPITATQFAATHQMQVKDSGNCVTLRGPWVTVRLYPGTRQVSVGGDTHQLKDVIERRGSKVYLPGRPVQFLSSKVMAKRRAILAQRDAVHVPRTPATATGGRLARRSGAAAAGHAAPSGNLPDWKPYRRQLPTARKPKQPTIRSKVRAPDPSWAPNTGDRAWKYVVIHHSDDNRGNAAKYDRHHREVNGWDSLGYHFVIGNGSLSGDGEVEIGPRWPVQKHGAHARNHDLGDNRYNEQGVGVCLVGDFDEGGLRPSARQMDQLVRLTRWLMKRYQIPVSRVIRHCDACTTECPGRHFPWQTFLGRIR